MTKVVSLLHGVDASMVRTDPYPHVVVKDALPDDYYAQLKRALPSPSSLGVDESKNNWRWNRGTAQVIGNAQIPEIWRDFVAYHASDAFFGEIVDLFYPAIHALYPSHFPSLDYMKRMRVGIRGRDSFKRYDILVDAQISGNTPVREPSAVRTTHIDNGSKLFSGLFYMRDEDDDSTGGDLEICRFRPEYAALDKKTACFDGVYVPDEAVEVVDTVRYSRNCLVLFINTLDSLHGVTVRQATPHGRFFVNLIGEVVSRLYEQRGGHPYYVSLPRPMDSLVPPLSVVKRRWRSKVAAAADDI